jgi:hypothetical protein
MVLSLRANIKPLEKGSPRINTLAYWSTAKEEEFYYVDAVVNVVKRFSLSLTETILIRVFTPWYNI